MRRNRIQGSSLSVWAIRFGIVLFAATIGFTPNESNALCQDEKADQDEQANQSNQDSTTPFQTKLGEVYGSNKPQGFTANSYLREIVSGEANNKKFQRLIKQLGSDNYQERVRAEAELFSLPVLPNTFQQYVSENAELEVKFRIKAIFENRKDRVDDLLVAALRTIEISKSTDAIDSILELVLQNESAEVKNTAKSTFASIVQAQHFEMIKAQLKHEDESMRFYFVNLIAKVRTKDWTTTLTPLLASDSSKMRLHVARLLIDDENRDALKTFVDLLSDPSFSMRIQSEQILRALTGKQFGRLTYNNIVKNRAIIKEWNDWAAANLATVKLNLPLKKHLRFESRLHGHTLIAMNATDVVELDYDRKEIVRLPQKGVLSAEKTLGGNYLLCSYSPGWLREIDKTGKTIWEIKGPKFNNAMPLNNGNVLVTLGGTKLIQEIDPTTKKTVWEYKATWWPNDAFRLQNGNTLIGGKGGVIEVSPDKKIVWQYDNPEGSTIVVAKPTQNGTFLVGWTSGIAREITRDKKTAWEYRTKRKLNEVFRDSNGHTFIADESSIFEIDADKKVVWEMKKLAKTASIRR